MPDNNMDGYKSIGQRIREHRRAQGLSQADLAEKAHISLTQISSIELGKAKMQVATFCKIAEALRVSADELLRLDVPAVNQIYQKEMQELLSDCTPDELESIQKIVREIKESLHKKPKEYDE